MSYRLQVRKLLWSAHLTFLHHWGRPADCILTLLPQTSSRYSKAGGGWHRWRCCRENSSWRKAEGCTKSAQRKERPWLGTKVYFYIHVTCSLLKIHEENTCWRLWPSICPHVSPPLLNKYWWKLVPCNLNLVSRDVTSLPKQSPTWRTRVFIFVWHLPLHSFSKIDYQQLHYDQHSLWDYRYSHSPSPQ